MRPPRIVAVSNSIDVSNRVPHFVTDGRATRYEVKRSPQSYPFAALHGVRVNGSRLEGGADPQPTACALAVGHETPLGVIAAREGCMTVWLLPA